MEHEFWLTRWREGKIGFHQPEGHPMLRAHMEKLDGAPGRRLLVPLCGKTFDLRLLAERGFAVTGVELAADAAAAFFVEQGWEANAHEGGAWGPGRKVEGHGVAILVGDFFSFTSAAVGPFEAVYDRAALVALPPEMRARYAQHLISLMAPGAVTLLITFAYDQSIADGPPFSVPEQEVRALFSPSCSVELLEESAAEVTSVSLRERGVSKLIEQLWLLKRSSDAVG